MARLAAMAIICLTSCRLCASQEEGGMGLEVIGLGLDIADMIIGSQDHKEIMDALEEIQNELNEIKAKLAEIQQTLNEVLVEVKGLDIKIALSDLNQAHVAVMTAFAQLQVNAGPTSKIAYLNSMAEEILKIDSGLMEAREHYYEALMGTLPSQKPYGKTLPQEFFDKTGLFPKHLLEGVARTIGINQALISWAFMQTGQVSGRQNDKTIWAKKMDAAWDKNKAIFKLGSCRWSTNHKIVLSCDSTRYERATVLVNGSRPRVGHTSCDPSGPNSISIPTRGSDHDDWGFDVSCAKAATGLQGVSNVPHGHKVSYVAGFKLHCKDGRDSAETTHFLHDGGDIYWDVKLDEPLLSVKGCVNRPHGRHEITYWASAEFTGISGAKGQITSHGNSCDKDSERYEMSCSKGYCMKRFQGFSDVPHGHTISYIACLNIYCGLCFDTQHALSNTAVVV